MEKPRITVRLNGSEPGPPPGAASPALSGPARPSGGKGKPARLSATEHGANAADGGGGFSWPVREVDEEGIEWGSPYSRKRPGQGKTGAGALALSIGAAVVVGTLMGLVVLSLFSPGENDPATGSIDSHLKTVPSEMEGADAGKNQKPETEASSTVSLPELKAVLVQRGIFQEKAGASKTVMNQRTQGLAAVMTEEAPYRIYQGVAPDKESAAKLSAGFKEKDGEVFYKEIRLGKPVPAPKGVSAGWKKALPSAVEEGNRIFGTMTDTTVKGAAAAGSSPDFTGARKKVNESYTRFTKVRDDVEKELPDRAKTEWVQMVRAMDLVVQSTQSENPNQAMFWQIQEGLVRYALAYEKLLQALD